MRRMSVENPGWGAPRISRRTAEAWHQHRRDQSEQYLVAQPILLERQKKFN
jgi:hypothetical protein